MGRKLPGYNSWITNTGVSLPSFGSSGIILDFLSLNTIRFCIDMTQGLAQQSTQITHHSSSRLQILKSDIFVRYVTLQLVVKFSFVHIHFRRYYGLLSKY